MFEVITQIIMSIALKLNRQSTSCCFIHYISKQCFQTRSNQVVENQPAFAVNSQQLSKLKLWEGSNHISSIPDHCKYLIPQKIELPWYSTTRYTIMIKNVFSKQECNSIINLCNELGFEDALINIGNGKQIKNTGVRDSDRCLIDSIEITEHLYSRINKFIPKYFKQYNSIRKCIGLNKRLRVLKYNNGGYFKPHGDGSYYENINDESNRNRTLITLLLYLNDQNIEFKGGELNFLDPKLNIII